MKNIEKYKDIILDNTDVCSINRLLLKSNIKGFCSGFACVGCEARAIKWLLEEAKELPWKPKERCEFYYYGVNGVIKTIWTGTTFDYYRWKFGNCFKTREEAETKGKEIMEAIQKEYRES